jgi:glycosyltransferase involved in cell wall biosynthesis
MRICKIVQYFPYKEHFEGLPVEKGYYLGGGVGKHVYYLSKELSKENDVTIITTKSPQHDKLSEIDLDVDIRRVPLGIPFYSSSIPLRILKDLNPSEYDVLHADTPNSGIADLAALKNIKKRCPFVLTYHNDIIKEGFLGNIVSMIYNHSAGMFLLKHTNVIIATTKSYAMNSLQLRKYTNKVKIIPNGVDTNMFYPNLEGVEIRKKYEMSETDRIILFVGKLDYYKGCDYLIRAFSEVVKKIANAHLLFVGSGPLEGELREIAKRLNVSHNITFAGYVKDKELPYYYAACDIFVLPSVSSYEGFGMVQLEAMACGKPVITTTLPGVKEVDANEVATVHVPPKDSIVLANAIMGLLENEDLARQMGMNGRKLVEEEYTWERVAEETEKVYQEVLI